MKSEQLAEYAKLVEGPGNCGEHRDAIAALLAYTHDLECRVEILKEQADAKNDLRAELAESDLQLGEAREALLNIAHGGHHKGACTETTCDPMCPSGIAEAALSEKQNNEKPPKDPSGRCVKCGHKAINCEC